MATKQQNTGLPALKASLSSAAVSEKITSILKADSDSFKASIIDLYGSDPKLVKCDNNLIIKECLRAAAMHLPINRALGFAYVVVFNNKITTIDEKGNKKDEWIPTPAFLLSKKGYIQLALRTGQYKYINADTVYEGELINIDKLTGEVNLTGKRKSDKVVGYFAHIELINGFTKTLYMDLHSMAIYAKRYSKSIKKDTTVDALEKLAGTESQTNTLGWEGNFDAMGEKTCLRRLLSQYGILSTEMQMQMAAEADAEAAAYPAPINEVVQDVTYTDVTAEPKAVQAAQPQAVNVPTAAPEPKTITVEEECGF